MTCFHGNTVTAVITHVTAHDDCQQEDKQLSQRQMAANSVKMADSQYFRPSASFISFIGSLENGVLSSGGASVAHISRAMELASLCLKRRLLRDSSGAVLTGLEAGRLLFTRLERRLPCERDRTKSGSTRRQGVAAGHQRKYRGIILSNFAPQPFIELERHQMSLIISYGSRRGSVVQKELLQGREVGWAGRHNVQVLELR